MTTATAVHPRAQELADFVERDYRQVVGAVTLITGDRAAAEDAVQDALVKAWRRRDEPLERLAAWVTVVASNEARGRRRRSGAEQRAMQRVARTADPAPTDAIPEPADVRAAGSARSPSTGRSRSRSWRQADRSCSRPSPGRRCRCG